MLDEPGWNGDTVRSTCDFITVIDATVDILVRASIEAGETVDDDVLFMISRNLSKGREGMVDRLSSKVADSHDATGFSGNRNNVSNGHMPAYGFFGTGEWMEQIFEGTF